MNSIRTAIPGRSQLIPGDFLGIEGVGFEKTFYFVQIIAWRFCGEEFLRQTQAFGSRLGFDVIELAMGLFSVGNVKLIVVFPVLFQNDPGPLRDILFGGRR